MTATLMSSGLRPASERFAAGLLTPGAMVIPGSGECLQIEHDPVSGQLRLHGGGRTYLERASGTAPTIYGEGLATAVETVLPRAVLRQVHTARASWVEEYRWDETNRLCLVDGVQIEHDAAGRVVACRGPAGHWRYGYAGDGLVTIDGPHGARTIATGDRGRPVRLRTADGVDDLRYDAAGERQDRAVLPTHTHHRDAAGRLWTITDGQGRVLTTYLWYGFACFGRIDGPLGQPLAAVFSLDPTGTPVRLITATGVTRLWRDAFGEGLLAVPNVPGLFGGAIHAGQIHFVARTLDPRVGAFTAPDPLDGTADDPRRAAGYRGPLLVERPDSPYAVCQHDPVGRSDPTGELSGWAHILWLLPSTLTWSFINNLIGVFGMDWIVNLWGSLFTGNGEFFSSEFLGSNNSFGIRRAGMMESFNKNNAWTYQHIVWASGRFLEFLAFARVFVPAGEFRPRLYGTLLRCAPSSGPPFVLQGGRFPNWSEPPRDHFLRGAGSSERPMMGWTRSGGPAEPVIPGAPIPWFPAGGLHFDFARYSTPCPQPGTLTEVELMGALATGTMRSRARLRLPATGLGLAVDRYLLLSDAANDLRIDQVQVVSEADGATMLSLKTELTGFATSGLRLRGLSSPEAAENLSHEAATPPVYLSVLGSARAYQRDDVLRLSQGGSPVGVGTVVRLEAKLALNTALPSLSAPLAVHVAQALDPARPAQLAAQANRLEMLAAVTPPLPKVVLALISNDAETVKLPVVLTHQMGNIWQADQSLQATFGAAGTTVRWRRLSGAARLGLTEGAPPTDASLTYVPDTVRGAPTTGYIRITDARGTQAVREVTGRTYDALVLAAALPGNAANPYSVERFTLQAPDQRDLQLTRGAALTLAPAPPAEMSALLLYQFGTPTLTPGAVALAGGTVSGATLTYPATGGATPLAAAPRPLQVIGINTGAPALVPAVVTGLQLSITLDRALEPPFDHLQPDLRIVRLGVGSPDYEATLVSAPGVSPVVVTVKPSAQVTPSGGGAATSVALAMPRFNVGELVRVRTTAAPPETRRYRIQGVEPDGTTLTLESGAALPVALASGADLIVTRLVPADPGNGTPWAGIGGTNQDAQHLTFAVWSPDALRRDDEVAIATLANDRSYPAVISSTDRLVIGFVAATTIPAGAHDIETPAATSTGAAARFVRDGSELTVEGVDLTAGPNLIVAVPFKDSPRTTAGRLSGGTTRVPDEIDRRELSRRSALETHELTHTLQSAAWGPLLLFPLPLFVLELPIDLASDAALPQFSRFVPARIIADGGNRYLQIPDAQGVPFEPNDGVQLAWAAAQPGGTTAPDAGRLNSTRLGSRRNANEYLISDGVQTIPNTVTELQIRRMASDSARGWSITLAILKLLTPGGLLKWVGTFQFGGLLWLFAHFFYWIGEVTGGSETYPAQVEGSGADSGKLLRPTSDEGRRRVANAPMIFIKSGDSTVIQSVERVEGGVIRLREACPFTGEVRVAPYETGTPDDSWDWRSYYPARVPEISRPTAIRIEAVGDDRLTLRAFDRVVCKAGTETANRIVVAIGAGDLIELNEPPPTATAERTFRIAHISSADPTTQYADINNFLMDEMGLDWLRYVFDPYGAIATHHVRPERGSWSDVLLRVMRYILSSEGWSLGGFFWSKFKLDRMAARSAGKDHLSQMEQEASSSSGDLYTSLGRLRGFGQRKVVGDVGRYWFVRAARESSVLRRGQSDGPGIHVADIPRLIPAVDPGPAPVAGDPQPNAQATITAGHSDPGLDVPDDLYEKSFTNPTAAAVGRPRGFRPTQRGWLPASGELELACGMYVAFTRPGRHRMTVANGEADADDREAQDRGVQTLFFDETIDPVIVRALGQEITEGQTLQLVQTQTLTIRVEPDGERRYAASLLRPQTGSLLRRPDATAPLLIAAQTSNGDEPVEISRVYRYDRDRRAYDAPTLQQHGLHLPTDLHIPVRRFRVTVVDTLPLRDALALTSASEITELSRDRDAFIIVPTSVGPAGLTVASATAVGSGSPVASLAAIAAFAPEPRELTAELRSALGAAARAYRLRVAAATAIPGPVAVRLTVQVGAAAPYATLTISFTLRP